MGNGRTVQLALTILLLVGLAGLAESAVDESLAQGVVALVVVVLAAAVLSWLQRTH